MPRIEQLPNGGYIRTLSTTERAIIKKLYDEIHERKVSYQELLDKFIALSNQVTVMNTQLQELRAQVGNK